jgi:hypothetical protein
MLDTAASATAEPTSDTGVEIQAQSDTSLIRLDQFRADLRFSGIDGRGVSVDVIDTGIDLNHSFFGPAGFNGVADWIPGRLRRERMTKPSDDGATVGSPGAVTNPTPDALLRTAMSVSGNVAAPQARKSRSKLSIVITSGNSIAKGRRLSTKDRYASFCIAPNEATDDCKAALAACDKLRDGTTPGDGWR